MFGRITPICKVVLLYFTLRCWMAKYKKKATFQMFYYIHSNNEFNGRYGWSICGDLLERRRENGFNVEYLMKK